MSEAVAVTKAEVVLAHRSELGEGSLWSVSLGKLLWVDILKHELHLFDPTTNQDRTYHIDNDGERFVSTVVERQSGGVVVSLQYGLAHVDLETGVVTKLKDYHQDAEVRFNDGKCDPEGRLYVGTMAINCQGTRGALYRIGADLSEIIVVRAVGISNGIVWSSDKRTMYYIDSPTLCIVAYDYDHTTGNIANRRVFLDFKQEGLQGLPDGMTIDAEDNIWVAHWDGSCVTGWCTKTRKHLRTIEVPLAKQVTSVAFGGPDLSDLYITTAATIAKPEDTQAGFLFRATGLGVKGLPAPKFVG
eukprot:TRINITY_DN4376_c0_g1_i1.p1 TRINITY_DN4376_c0_g1~~TRINITY_DN4376_c0_g1_i1.p1  ORF type:complete len:301 (-),score=55.06 TRINITY_DN4376_c0_g1_i1:100-1002(-)